MIRVGIGGWVFKPWRGEFYPEGLPQARELGLCQPQADRDRDQRHLLQHAEAGELPEMGRRDAGRFRVLAQGATLSPPIGACWPKRANRSSASLRAACSELKGKLGPILWQFHPGKKFEPDDFAAFLALLPRRLDGSPSAMRSRCGTRAFSAPAFIALLRKFSVAPVAGRFRQASADRRCHRATSSMPACSARRRRKRPAIPPRALDAWAKRAQTFADGGAPDDLATIARRAPAPAQAGRVHLHDLGREGARPGGGDGADRTAQVRRRLREMPSGSLIAASLSPRLRTPSMLECSRDMALVDDRSAPRPPIPRRWRRTRRPRASSRRRRSSAMCRRQSLRWWACRARAGRGARHRRRAGGAAQDAGAADLALALCARRHALR